MKKVQSTMRNHKSFFLFILFFISMISVDGTASAHSVLDASIPEAGSVVDQALEEVELSFNTKIELGSTFYIVDKSSDKEIHPNQIKIKGNVVKGLFAKQFSDGSYMVKWKMIGADGHPVEGSYRFEVSSKTSEKEAKGDQDTVLKKVDQNNEKASLSEENKGNIDKKKVNGKNNTKLNIIIPLLTLLVFTLLFFLLKRRKMRS